jgi:hypothetical protein
MRRLSNARHIIIHTVVTRTNTRLRVTWLVYKEVSHVMLPRMRQLSLSLLYSFPKILVNGGYFPNILRKGSPNLGNQPSSGPMMMMMMVTSMIMIIITKFIVQLFIFVCRDNSYKADHKQHRVNTGFNTRQIKVIIIIIIITPWLESASELYRPSDRRL